MDSTVQMTVDRYFPKRLKVIKDEDEQPEQRRLAFVQKIREQKEVNSQFQSFVNLVKGQPSLLLMSTFGTPVSATPQDLEVPEAFPTSVMNPMFVESASPHSTVTEQVGEKRRRSTSFVLPTQAPLRQSVERDSDLSSYDETDESADEQEEEEQTVPSRRRSCASNGSKSVPREIKGGKKKRVTFTGPQKKIMQRWRTEHTGTWAALYPSKTQCAKLANEAHLKPKQVEKHFDNFRQRHLAGIQRPKGRPSSSAPIPTIIEGEIALVWPETGRVEKQGTKVMEESDEE